VPIINGYDIVFSETGSGLYEASVTDGTRSLPIYLLFEEDQKNRIKTGIEAVKFKENVTLDFFGMVVAGCIKTCMRY
jgi:hypothetical protein